MDEKHNWVPCCLPCEQTLGDREDEKMAVVIKIKVRIPEWLDRICAWPVTAYRCRKYGHSFRRIGLPDRQYAIVDEKDFYQLNNYEWFAKGFSGLFYAIRFDNSNKKETKIISMHREIMNDPAGYMVDHRNCDTFDNRRDNLRLATRFQNGCNSRQDKSKTSSRYRGVHKIKKTGRWAANIRVNGKKTWLGSFETEIEAARAYDAAARKYHGEFARLNFP